VREQLTELRGYRLLAGFRGSKPADLDALVEVILAIATLAGRAAPWASAVEVNPLLVDGDRIEALGVLVATADRLRPDRDGRRP
jgi:acetate---CoA ligase (ADP-forming)